jgi:hypothetical protein
LWFFLDVLGFEWSGTRAQAKGYPFISGMSDTDRIVGITLALEFGDYEISKYEISKGGVAGESSSVFIRCR